MTTANFIDPYPPHSPTSWPNELKDLPAPELQPLPEALLAESSHQGLKVDVLRLDAIHPLVSGNKWYKLKYNIAQGREQGMAHLLSFGGMHSNHLHALAAAGQYFGLRTTGIVRGYADQPLSQTMIQCQQMGMNIQLVDKLTYRRRYEQSWCDELARRYVARVIPEGGNNQAGQLGCMEIASHCQGYDEIWLAVGSGATYTGLAQGLVSGQALVGVMALKGAHALARQLIAAGPAGIQQRIIEDAHWGGFAKCPAPLIDFIHQADRAGLRLDPVYTAKMLAAFCAYSNSPAFDPGKSYLLIHTGGLQGRAGIKALSAL